MKRQYGLTPLERIERYRTITSSGCWECGLVPSKIYSWIKVDGKQVAVHRQVYSDLVGPIPDGLLVCHTCDNPRCHNPDHLFLGTYADNNRDCREKGRHVAAKKPVHGLSIRSQIERLHELPQMVIAERLGVSQTFVSMVLRKAGLSRTRSTTYGKAHIGETHGRALVNEDQVREIRASTGPASAVAPKYGISPATVYAIRTRTIWKHVE